MKPNSDEVRVQLERILASEPFANAERARRFLQYVVERALAGEGDQLKEFVIGVEVFDRNDQYDPRIDSIVRVEAGRLRAKLDRYYSCGASDDGVVIAIPRGSYVPEFAYRSFPKPSNAWYLRRGPTALAVAILATGVVAWTAGHRPTRNTPTPPVSIAVLPFEQFSTDAADQLLAARMTDGVTSELARTRAVSVVSRTSAVQVSTQGRTLRQIAAALGADVVVEGSVSVDDNRVTVDVRLVDAGVDRKGWGASFVAERSGLRALQQQVAAAIAAAAVRPAPPR